MTWWRKWAKIDRSLTWEDKKLFVGERNSIEWRRKRKEKKQNCSIYARKLQQWSRSNLPLMSLLPKTAENFWRRNYKQVSKFSGPKILNAWNGTSLTFQSSHSASACSRASAALMSSSNRGFISCWFVRRAYCNLRNEIKICNLQNKLEICNLRNRNVSFAKRESVIV